MTRDMDLVRELLLRIEADPRYDGIGQFVIGVRRGEEGEGGEGEFDVPGHSDREVVYHLRHLVEAGYVKGRLTISWASISQLTWQGHELLDSIRDPEALRRAKEGARKVGSGSLDFMWQLAKAYGKQLAKEKLGVELP